MTTILKTAAVLVITGDLLLSLGFGNPKIKKLDARCSGGANCHACTNRSACKNFHEQGGACSVCSPRYNIRSQEKPADSNQ